MPWVRCRATRAYGRGAGDVYADAHLACDMRALAGRACLSQNANIFVKNIHFFATLLQYVASELGIELGEYTHWITNLCHDRTATSC